jgi:hypothetical protein
VAVLRSSVEKGRQRETTSNGTEENLIGTTGIACLHGSMRLKWTVIPSCQQTVWEQVTPVLKQA